MLFRSYREAHGKLPSGTNWDALNWLTNQTGEMTFMGLAPTGTPFQLAVWTELTKIPYGSTVTYGSIALALGKRLVASRAVGLANGSNPISVIVPCHRVIGSDGSLTGYGGGLERKELLLKLEGAGPVTLF